MVGVVHASDPINAVQRFMGRIELGMVPHIVDTVIFVKSGKIEKVLELSLVVKVPSGMNEPDLARPVVEVREFESGKLAYEIYTFGEENVIIPVDRASPSNESKETALEKLAKERILQVIRKFDSEAQVTILSPQKVQVKIKESMIPRIIGKGGSQIKELEELLKVHIDVEPKDHKDSEESNEDDLSFDLRQKGENIELLFAPDLVGTEVRLYSQSEMLLQTRISNKGKIKIPKRSETGQEIMRALRFDSLEIKKM